MSIKQLAHRLLVRCLCAMQDLNSVNDADHPVCPWQKVRRTPHCVPITPEGRSFYLDFGRAPVFRLNLEERGTGHEEDESMR